MVYHMAEYFAERISSRLKIIGQDDRHHAMWYVVGVCSVGWRV